MAVPRLPFLWPMLWKPSTAPRIRARARAPPPERTFATTSYRCVEAPIQRYGKAHEPAPHLRAEMEKTDPTPPKIPHDPAKDVEEEEEEHEGHIPTETPATPSKTSSIDDTPPVYTPPRRRRQVTQSRSTACCTCPALRRRAQTAAPENTTIRAPLRHLRAGAPTVEIHVL